MIYGGWVVCYCDPRKVLDVVNGLSARGVQAVCPWSWAQKRLPRRKALVRWKAPILGGLFFLRGEDWPLRGGAISGVELSRIRLMMIGEKVCQVSKWEIDQIRGQKVDEPELVRVFQPGECVVVNSGPFKGYRGKVRWCNDGWAEVSLQDGFPAIKFRTFLLLEDQA